VIADDCVGAAFVPCAYLADLMSEVGLPDRLGPALRVFLWASPVFAFGFESVVMLLEGQFLRSIVSFLIAVGLVAVLARWQAIKVQLEPPLRGAATLIAVQGRRLLIRRLEDPWYSEAYKVILTFGLEQVDAAFGSKKPSASGYLFCTVVSFVYILFGFVTAWALGGPGKIGYTILLPENWSNISRQVFALLLVGVCIGLYVFTAFPLAAIQFVRRKLRQTISTSVHQRVGVATIATLLFLLIVEATTRDWVLVALLAGSTLILGIWLSSLTFFGGAIIGSVAAIFSGAAFDGSHRFLAGAAILSVVALGGSHGTRAVATLMTRKNRHFVTRLFGRFGTEGRTRSWYEKSFPFVVFACVGATGGATFVASAARTYSYLLGPSIDVDLLDAFGFESTSLAFPLAGGLAGFIGGAFAARFGRGAVICSAFVCAFLLIAILGTHVLSNYNLYDYFGAKTLIGAAMMNILLFFILLPPINAFWDWIAWETSRAFGRNLLQQITVSRIIVHIIGGLLIGAALLIGLVVSDTLAITAFNKWMFVNTHTVPLPVDLVARAALQRPRSPEGLWISMMLFSTFLPTLCHFMFVLFGVLLIRTPEAWRVKLAGILSDPRSQIELMLPIIYFALLPLIGIVCLSCLIWLSFLVFSSLGAPVSRLLYELVHLLTG